jgi:hypothetical protein
VKKKKKDEKHDTKSSLDLSSCELKIKCPSFID